MTEREKQQGQPMEAMREKSQPGKYMNEGRLTVVVVALAILTFLGILSETAEHRLFDTDGGIRHFR